MTIESLPLLTFAPDANPDPAAVYVDLDTLITSRLLVQANSGSGKSRALRSLLEQTHGRVPHFVIDPEGEFGSLRERFDYVLVGGENGDLPATTASARVLCRQLMELGASVVFDLSEQSQAARRAFVRELLTELMALPKALWRPLLVVMDEAHIFAPEGGAVESSEAVVSLCVQGRKRGFCPVLAVQRLSRLDKDVAAELINKLIGRTGLDVDVKRAGDELGFDAAQRKTLKTLAPGQFYAYGPAISPVVTLVRTGDVQTTHHQPGQVGGVLPPPAPAAIAALLEQLKMLPPVSDTASEAAGAGAAAGRNPARSAETVRVETRVERVEVPVYVLREGEADRLLDTANNLAGLAKDLMAQSVEIRAAVSRATVPAVPAPAKSAPEREATALPPAVSTLEPPRSEKPAAPSPPTQGGKPQAMLNRIADYGALGAKGVARAVLAVQTDQSPKSSQYAKYLSELRDAGLITFRGDGLVTLTDKGRSRANVSPTPPTRADLHRSWLARLGKAEAAFLTVLIARYPHTVAQDALAKQAGYSPTSSTVGATLAALVEWGLAERPRPGEAVATALLFPKGLK